MERCHRHWQKPSDGWRFCVKKDAVKELLLVCHFLQVKTAVPPFPFPHKQIPRLLICKSYPRTSVGKASR
jgi:hypothetical protein